LDCSLLLSASTKVYSSSQKAATSCQDEPGMLLLFVSPEQPYQRTTAKSA